MEYFFNKNVSENNAKIFQNMLQSSLAQNYFFILITLYLLVLSVFELSMIIYSKLLTKILWFGIITTNM